MLSLLSLYKYSIQYYFVTSILFFVVLLLVVVMLVYATIKYI